MITGDGMDRKFYTREEYLELEGRAKEAEEKLSSVREELESVRDSHLDFLRKENRRRLASLAHQAHFEERVTSLEKEVITDPLTGIYNRAFVFGALETRVPDARRHEYPLSVAMIDIDNFKCVNDEHGHPVGDEVLVAVAQYMASNLRKGDVVGRYGGEEFLAVMRATENHACDIAENLRKGWKQHYQEKREEEWPEGLTVSVGVYGLKKGDTYESLVKRADQALCSAKKLGRDRVVRFSGISD